MRRQVITADAQDLDIVLLEAVIIPPEGDRLLGSATGEVQHMEGQNNMLLPPELTQGNAVVLSRGQGEIGGNLANISRHRISFSVVFGRMHDDL